MSHEMKHVCFDTQKNDFFFLASAIQKAFIKN